jgi:DNA-binding NarL/FixJ family response regulator
MQPIKVIIAEDHKILLDSLCLLIGSIEGIEIVGKASNGKQALQLLDNQAVDIIISDLGMPIMNGIELTWQVRQHFPKVKILILTVAEEAVSIKDALQAGANGYVFKSAEREELEQAIKAISAGKKHFSEDAIMKLAQMPSDVEQPIEDLKKISLTDREIEVLKLISQELSGMAIAEKLFISPTTVESHRKNLFQKIGVNTSVGLVKYAMTHGIL